MNRGSAVDALWLAVVDTASMRPRFMNRGSRSAPARTAGCRPGFNEAPIHESGKYVRSPRAVVQAVELQ